MIVEKLTKNQFKLPVGYELVSLDVESLYTNVPVKEAIDLATNLIYECEEVPPFDKETCRELLMLCCSNTVLKVNDKIYIQTDGLSMGSKIAPLLANIWLAYYDDNIRNGADVYFRYMDDICTIVKVGDEEELLDRVNGMHPNLRFTMEKLHHTDDGLDTLGYISFLDMKITVWHDRTITTEWYRKESSTDVLMDWFAWAPMRYKVNIVHGLVNRIWDTCSTYKNFTRCLEEAKRILQKNRYPADWVDNKIGLAVEKVFLTKSNPNETNKVKFKKKEVVNATEERMRRNVFLKYKGAVTEKLAMDLSKISAPIRIVFTLDKMRTYVSHLKSKTERCNQSNLVYKFKCGFCIEAPSYIGYTERLLSERLREHRKNGTTEVSEHLRQCGGELDQENVEVLYKANKSKGLMYIKTAEALFIRSEKPNLNNKDEFRARKLRLKLF